MPVFLSLLPLVLAITLIAMRRVTLASAGLVALAATLPSILYLRGTEGLAYFLWIESLKGGWVSLQGLSVIFAGVVLYQVLHRRPAAQNGTAPEGDPHRAAFAACFLFGTFVESAIGFGVGVIIAAAGLMRLGLSGPATAVLSLFSQLLVPWGAMAVGTGIGADLLGIPVEALGTRAAEVTALTLLVLLPFFWWLLRRAGVALRPLNLVFDTMLIVALGGLLILVNRYVAVELGGILPPGLLAVVVMLPRFFRDRRQAEAAIRGVWPYLLLAGALLATRLVPGLPALLHSAFDLRPFAGMPSFPVFYHASFWLLVTAMVAAPLAVWRDGARGVMRDSVAMARTPLLVTLFFVVQAQWMLASGSAAALGAGWQAFAGDLAVLAAPLFSASIAGPSGANTAAIAMMMPVMAPIATATGMSVVIVAGVQNLAGGLSTLLSPGRIALAAGLLRCEGGEMAVYREVLPLAPILLLAPVAVLAVLVLW